MDVNFPQFTENTGIKGFNLHVFFTSIFLIFFSECFDYVLVLLYLRRSLFIPYFSVSLLDVKRIAFSMKNSIQHRYTKDGRKIGALLRWLWLCIERSQVKLSLQV